MSDKGAKAIFCFLKIALQFKSVKGRHLGWQTAELTPSEGFEMLVFQESREEVLVVQKCEWFVSRDVGVRLC